MYYLEKNLALLGIAYRAAAKLTAGEDRLGELCAFVPASPDAAATTFATTVTAVSAALSGEPTLLLDFGIRLGVTSFLLKAEGNRTIVDALQQGNGWTQTFAWWHSTGISTCWVPAQ